MVKVRVSENVCRSIHLKSIELLDYRPTIIRVWRVPWGVERAVESVRGVSPCWSVGCCCCCCLWWRNVFVLLLPVCTIMSVMMLSSVFWHRVIGSSVSPSPVINTVKQLVTDIQCSTLSLLSFLGRQIEYQLVWLIGLRRSAFSWVAGGR